MRHNPQLLHALHNGRCVRARHWLIAGHYPYCTSGTPDAISYFTMALILFSICR